MYNYNIILIFYIHWIKSLRHHWCYNGFQQMVEKVYVYLLFLINHPKCDLVCKNGIRSNALTVTILRFIWDYTIILSFRTWDTTFCNLYQLVNLDICNLYQLVGLIWTFVLLLAHMRVIWDTVITLCLGCFHILIFSEAIGPIETKPGINVHWIGKGKIYLR